MTVLRATCVVEPDGLLTPGEVELAEGRILDVRPAGGAAPDTILAPGFVDLQANGLGRVDVAAASGADWDLLDHALLAQGVTTWCPTLTTSPLDAYAAPLERIATAAARPTTQRPTIAGAHLEGPFLGERTGAHDPALVRAPDPAWLDALPPIVRIVTLGPEQPGAVSAVARLARRGVVVALGHTAADHDLARSAVDAGARLVTHCFNAMVPLHHREPGVVGVALTDDRLRVGLIADGVHVHPIALRLAFRAKGPGRVVLVTDSVAVDPVARGGPRLVDGAPRLADGTLAGTALTMPRAVATCVTEAGVPLGDALAAASATPAALLGLDDRGAIRVGARADLVELDRDLQPLRTWVGGRLAWSR